MGEIETLRAAGWSVAIHNDYRLKGGTYTFWLLTHPSGRWIKGEGGSDEQALGQCIRQAAAADMTGTVEAHDAAVAALAERDAIIKEAVKALRIWTGHDSGPNMRHHYGERWWEPINAIRNNLESLLSEKSNG